MEEDGDLKLFPYSEKYHAAGFSLVELMVVIAVFAILVALAAPSFSTLILSQRAKNASFDIFSSLIFARSEAIKRNTTITITPNEEDWSSGWAATEVATGTVLREQNAVNGLSITGPDGVSYNGMGRLSAVVSPFNLTASGLSESNSRCISIDLSGLPVVKTGTCS